MSSKTQAGTEEKSSQTDISGFFRQELYDEIAQKSSAKFDMKEEIIRVRAKCNEIFGANGYPEMDPGKLERICLEANALNIFPFIHNAMCQDRASESRCYLNKIRTMVVIYMMIYGQSQRANWFQVALSRTLSQHGISDCGLASLRNLGITAHPRTVTLASLSSASSHLSSVNEFIKEAADKQHFIVFFIDDFHNIHTMHRPSDKKQSQSVHMSTLLIKVFKNINAIPVERNASALNKEPANASLLKAIVDRCMSTLSKTYAQVMPDYITSKYFDPEEERRRLLIHDYQQTELKEMRSMHNTKLVDCLEMPLKNFQDTVAALEYIFHNELSTYLAKFFVPFIGDWPTQFYMRQFVYSDTVFLRNKRNILPFIGPLHISLNSRQSVVLKFYPLFKEMHCFLFGRKAVLAKKPKAWRQSLLLEILYGGWSLIRDEIMALFDKCKDTEYLTILNLLDNYCPLVLSLYSIEFKNNYFKNFFHSIVRCWVMLVIFNRRHYNKALIILLTSFYHLQITGHPLYQVLSNHLNAFDEYPVENCHSILRSKTKSTDTGEQIFRKAREIDACKNDLQEFQSWFVSKRKHAFCPKKIKSLKLQAAKFLISKFERIGDNPGQAKMIRRTRGQKKTLTKWMLPNIFGNEIVSNEVLPLAYNDPQTMPSNEK